MCEPPRPGAATLFSVSRVSREYCTARARGVRDRVHKTSVSLWLVCVQLNRERCALHARSVWREVFLDFDFYSWVNCLRLTPPPPSARSGVARRWEPMWEPLVSERGSGE